VPEPAVATEVGHPGLTLDLRVRRQLDRHVDGPDVAAEEAVLPPLLGRLDHQLAVGVLDARLSCGLDIGVVGCVARADLDDGVLAVARGDPGFADDEGDRGEDRFGGVESWHGGVSS
jgi:hypothetical protein